MDGELNFHQAASFFFSILLLAGNEYKWKSEI